MGRLISLLFQHFLYARVSELALLVWLNVFHESGPISSSFQSGGRCLELFQALVSETPYVHFYCNVYLFHCDLVNTHLGTQRTRVLKCPGRYIVAQMPRKNAWSLVLFLVAGWRTSSIPSVVIHKPLTLKKYSLKIWTCFHKYRQNTKLKFILVKWVWKGYWKDVKKHCLVWLNSQNYVKVIQIRSWLNLLINYSSKKY